MCQSFPGFTVVLDPLVTHLLDQAVMVFFCLEKLNLHFTPNTGFTMKRQRQQMNKSGFLALNEIKQTDAVKN